MYKYYVFTTLLRTASLHIPLYLPHRYNYRPQRSCEGYVFTFVCLSTGGVCLVHGGVWFRGGAWSWGGAWSRGVCSRGVVSQHALRQTPPGRDGYCCGQYASYWNAFLLLKNTLHLIQSDWVNYFNNKCNFCNMSTSSPRFSGKVLG